jgi:hypothetical protein
MIKQYNVTFALGYLTSRNKEPLSFLFVLKFNNTQQRFVLIIAHQQKRLKGGQIVSHTGSASCRFIFKFRNSILIKPSQTAEDQPVLFRNKQGTCTASSTQKPAVQPTFLFGGIAPNPLQRKD